jgi:hypothetical protein
MGHISVMLWALEVGEGGFLSQFLTRSVVVLSFTGPQSHVLRVKTPVSGSRCLIHWFKLTHPDFWRKTQGSQPMAVVGRFTRVADRIRAAFTPPQTRVGTSLPCRKSA